MYIFFLSLCSSVFKLQVEAFKSKNIMLHLSIQLTFIVSPQGNNETAVIDLLALLLSIIVAQFGESLSS